MNSMKLYALILICFTSLVARGQVRNQDDYSILQNIDSREKISMDGVWQIIIDPLENGYYNHRYQPKENGYFENKKMESPSDLIEYDFDTGLQISVPGDWNTQIEKLYYYEGTVWYKKSFDYKEKEGQKTFLYFEAANYEAIVYLNGEKLGSHVGGYTPFQFDVTGKLKPEGNYLILKVDNKRKREAIPTINTDWWNYGGITRSVWLIETPENYIKDYFVQLKKSSTNTIEGWALLNENTSEKEVVIQIPELNKKVTASVVNGKASFSFQAKPILWSPDNPKLYDVILTLNNDRITDKIGFRTIETDGQKILLNGKHIFLRGISIHEEAPFGENGRVTTKEECQTLLNWAKELGCNFIRLAHYPHSEAMVREAEKMGILIWSEIPVYWTVLFDNPDTYANAENQLKEMISRDKNRAAVILWSVANETPEGESRIHFLSALMAKARSLDGTRLMTAALDTQRGEGNTRVIQDELGEFVDVIGINSYCGWYGGKPESCAKWEWANDYNKPLIFSELGGGGLQGLHGKSNERWTEEYQDAVYKYNIEMLKKIENLAGLSPWILMDFRSPRRNLKRIQNDYNRKGLISNKGIRKKVFFTLQSY